MKYIKRLFSASKIAIFSRIYGYEIIITASPRRRKIAFLLCGHKEFQKLLGLESLEMPTAKPMHTHSYIFNFLKINKL